MIHIIIGTKAQLIKMAPVMRKLADRKTEYNYISTGQHKETVSDILENFSIKGPDEQIYSGRDITSVFAMLLWSVRILWICIMRKRKIFRNDKNGIVLVHGDTLSTVLGAIAGKITGLKVGHVESGLKSFNLMQPFPEEIFRRITFSLSDVMFCPGKWAVENLKKYNGEKIDTGMNTLYDSLNYAMPVLDSIKDVDIPSRKYAVATLHRFENVKDKTALGRIVDLLLQISQKMHIVFILHKITEKKLREFGLFEKLDGNDNFELRKRYDYFRFIKLLKTSEFVISDGGSNQEECFYMGKPLLLFRNVTERNEGIGKNAVLTKFDGKIISDFIKNYQSYSAGTETPLKSPSEIIADYCVDFS